MADGNVRTTINFFNMHNKKVTIKPAESTQIDSEIDVKLPDGLVGTLVVLSTIQTIGLKLENDNSIETNKS